MSRTSTRFRGIVLAASAVGAAAVLAACTPPLPPDVLAARAESQITCQSGDAQVSVPEEFAGAMTAVGQGLSGVCAEQTVTEVPGDQPASLALVSSAPTSDQLAAFSAQCPTDAAVVPAFAYPVSLAFNEPGLEGVVFTPAIVAGILDGSITEWSDPAIAEANPGLNFDGMSPFTVISTTTPSSAVAAMTAFLAKDPASGWTGGETGTLAVGEQVGSQQEIIDALLGTPGAIAVLPSAVASLNTFGTNAFIVQDQVVTTDDPAFAKIGSGATEVTTNADGTQLTASTAMGGVPVEGNFDLAASKVVLGEGQAMVGWPVLGYAHLLVCTNDPMALSTAQYVIRLAGQGALETFGVTPMPEPIRIKTFTPLKVTVATDAPAASPAGSAPGEASPAAS